MAEPETLETREAKIREVMERLGVSRDAARLYLAVEAGDAMVGDRISLAADQSLDDYLEEMGWELPLPQRSSAQ